MSKRENKVMAAAQQTESSIKEGVCLEIAKSWDGQALPAPAAARVSFRLSAQGLEVEVNAPFYDDPAPAAPAGELDGLWNYEVVELFMLGPGGHYLEIELGPHGHYLILLLSGIRQVKKRLQPGHCTTTIKGGRWQGNLVLPGDDLPLPFSHANAYAIHGQDSDRRYLAAVPVPGERPDFHQPRFFGPLPPC